MTRGQNRSKIIIVTLCVKYLFERITLMKTLEKVFIILGMIFGCAAIYPIVLGLIVLHKMKEGPLSTGWKVVTLLFVNLIAGILLLCDKDA